MTQKTDVVHAWRQRPRQLRPAEDILRRTAFDLLQHGHAIEWGQLLTTTGLPLSALKDAIASLEQQGLIECDATTGEVIGSFGLTLRETPHRLRLNGHDMYTWCALDVIGIPAALEADAEIQSNSPTCGRAITLRARAGKFFQEEVADLWIWLTRPHPKVSAVGET